MMLFARAFKMCLLGVALVCTCEAFTPSILPMPVPVTTRTSLKQVPRMASQGNRGQLSDAMKKKLAAESDAPLRFPLLWAAAVLTGKGSTDLVFTELKYVAGVSKEQLTLGMGAIDVVCITAGVALALRASDAWGGCLYNPTTWKLRAPWFLAQKEDGPAQEDVGLAQDE